MRVLHVYRTYFPDSQGGLQEVIRQICLSTKKLGVENRVFTLSEETTPVVEREEALVFRFPLTIEIASCGMSVNALAGFRRLVDWADVVHYHFPWPFADLLHLLAHVKKPSVLTYHSDIVRQKRLLMPYRYLMRTFLGKVDAIVATSPNYLATSATLKTVSEKVKVIPIGLDETSYPPVSAAQRDAMRARVGEGFFLFVGMLRYYKGLHILLDAVRNTDLKVVIVGSGPMEEGLLQQAEKAGLTNVRFLGQVEDEEKVALFQLSRAIVFTSHLRSEAFGVTLLEGAMYGKPLISTEIGTGTSYVNSHGETGLVVSPGERDELREAMQRLDQDVELAARMGKAARERFDRLFTADVMGDSYARLYAEEVIK